MLTDDTHAVMTAAELAALPEYSASVPTGTTIGKRWSRRRDCFDPSRGYFMGEYVPHPDPGRVGIVWREVLLVGGAEGGP